MNLEEKILKLIEMNNEIFLQHRYGRINPAYEDEAKALANELYAQDHDGSIVQRLTEAAKTFIAEELRQHPPGTVNPYADITPEPAEEEYPMTRTELLSQMDENMEDCIHELGIYLYAKAEDGDELQGPEIPIFVLWMWNIEMQNGGLCQFFVNDGEFAALVPSALKAVGAKEYAKLLNDFVEKHKIDLQDLSQFDLEIESMDADMSAYADATELYPFDEFDDRFYALYGSDPLEAYMAAYIRKNISSFTQE